jgi:hypothetical protein
MSRTRGRRRVGRRPAATRWPGLRDPFAPAGWLRRATMPRHHLQDREMTTHRIPVAGAGEPQPRLVTGWRPQRTDASRLVTPPARPADPSAGWQVRPPGGRSVRTLTVPPNRPHRATRTGKSAEPDAAGIFPCVFSRTGAGPPRGPGSQREPAAGHPRQPQRPAISVRILPVLAAIAAVRSGETEPPEVAGSGGRKGPRGAAGGRRQRGPPEVAGSGGRRGPRGAASALGENWQCTTATEMTQGGLPSTDGADRASASWR